MTTFVSVIALVMASLSCALSMAVALRVKSLLDPLAEQGMFGSGRTDSIMVGEPIPDLGAMTDIHGDSIEFPEAGGEPWILTFQSTGCPGCKQQLPRYKRYLKSLHIDRDRVFSVISGDDEGMDLYQAELDQVSRIIRADGSSDDLAQRLGVNSWPTYVVVSDSGAVSFSSTSAALLAGSVTDLGSPALGRVAP